MSLIQRIRQGTILSMALVAGTGCQLQWDTLDMSSVRRARAGFQEHYEQYPVSKETEVVGEKSPSIGSVVLGELLAFFPGVVVHGLGHTYAGDDETARKLRNVGAFGFLVGGAGAGLIVGGYYLDNATNDWDNMVYGLYGSGSFFSLIGAIYFVTAWGYDLLDTPRAVMSGGKPPPKSAFVDSLDLFE